GQAAAGAADAPHLAIRIGDRDRRILDAVDGEVPLAAGEVAAVRAVVEARARAAAHLAGRRYGIAEPGILLVQHFAVGDRLRPRVEGDCAGGQGLGLLE